MSNTHPSDPPTTEQTSPASAPSSSYSLWQLVYFFGGLSWMPAAFYGVGVFVEAL